MRLKSLVHHLFNFLSSTTPVTENEKVTEVNESDPAIEVEVMEPRRSGRSKKQTQLFRNPLLYRVT